MRMSRKLLTTILTAFLLLASFTQCMSKEVGDEVDIPLDGLCVGDIAFRRGESIASEVVMYNDVDGKYSHVGIVVETDSGLMIVHSVPGENRNSPNYDLILMERVEKYFSPEVAEKGEIMRMDLDSTQRRLLNKFAVEKVSQNVPFDHNYDLSDTTKLYCTELLQHLYAKIGIDLAQGRITSINVPGMSNDYIMPSDIYHNNKLKSIFVY